LNVCGSKPPAIRGRMTEQSQSDAKRPRTIRKLTIQQAYARALIMHNERRLAEVEKVYQAILQLDENHVGALQHLGALRTQQGRGEEAVGVIGGAVKLDPDSPELRNDFGMALAMLRRYAEATAEYGRALGLRPGFVAALGNLANTLLAMHRPDEAIVHLQQALAAQPQSAELRNNLGNALAALERHEEA